MPKFQTFQTWLLTIASMLTVWFSSYGEYAINTGGTINLGYGSNEFAPYYLHANHHGKLTQAKNAQLDLWVEDTLDRSKRFDFAWGLEALGGYANKANYRRWNPESRVWESNMQGPAAIWLQQLYGEIKWRCLYLRVGLKDLNSAFVDQNLSSGDLLWSGNSRGIPEARIGFIDFQTIPFTKKWLQFDVCLSYGKFIDTDWVNNHFDYYQGKRNPGPFWTYKRMALRTNPDKPFMFQAGIQMSGIFGGKTYYYYGGNFDRVNDNYNGFKDFVSILFPFWNSGEGYRAGDTKGTWDFAARYHFRGGETLRAYVQWPWEDSSGIAKKNGFDGLWGIEFKTGRYWWITGVVAEYLDLTHQSGPFLYDPNHAPGKPIPGFAGGLDAYYNNYYYRSYTNYGLNMGTPMVTGSLFDRGENPYIEENGTLPYYRVKGFHIAVEGNLSRRCTYMLKYNHRKAWGNTTSHTLIHPVEADSFFAGAQFSFPKIQGLALAGCIGVDYGNMPRKAIGGMLTLTYEREIIFK